MLCNPFFIGCLVNILEYISFVSTPELVKASTRGAITVALLATTCAKVGMTFQAQFHFPTPKTFGN